MKNVSIQIQSITFENKTDSLLRALESIDNAVQVARRDAPGLLDRITVCYGDASSGRLFETVDVERIAERFKHTFDFQYVFFNFNSGTAKGHNLLGAECSLDYMLIMNPDVLLSPGFFVEILRPFSQESMNVGLVEGRQTPVEHPKDYNIKTGETSWASTAAAIFRTELFHELDGFDHDSFFMYCDDVDFSWRIRLLGKSIIYQPTAVVFHAKRLSGEGMWLPTESEIYYSAEASLLMAYKWNHLSRSRKLLELFESSDSQTLQKVVSSYKGRLDSGTLPQPIQNAEKIAVFFGDNYAQHRFSL